MPAWAQGKTERVSVSSGGVQGNGSSLLPALSPDGRFVAFQSNASNLVEGDTNDAFDSFVHDRWTGRTKRVSVSPGGAQGNSNSFSFNTAVSSQGRFATFESDATNLVLGDTNGARDVFVRILTWR